MCAYYCVITCIITMNSFDELKADIFVLSLLFLKRKFNFKLLCISEVFTSIIFLTFSEIIQLFYLIVLV